jgi:prevent-host-death family protein
MPVARQDSRDLGSKEGISRLLTVTASDLKNKFGEVVAQAVKGAVAITRHQRPEFVLLSVEQYLELQQARTASLDALSAEFDVMVARMDAPGARRAAEQLFKAAPAALGKSAVKAARATRAR